MKSNIVNNHTNIFELFCVNHFFYRYLAGDTSLKETRHVTRKQLTLLSAGVEYLQREVLHQRELNDRFFLAVEIFRTHGVTLDSFCQVNAVFLGQSSNSGVYRLNQNWVGKTLEKAKYVPPNAKKISSYLQSLIDFINNGNTKTINKAIIAYTQLILIHPFSDANGRTARALMCFLLNQSEEKILPLCLYRLVSKKIDYIEALHNIDIEKPSYLPTYWLNAIKWEEEIKNKITNVTIEAQRQISTKKTLFFLSNDALELLSYLWRQPIILIDVVSKTKFWNINKTKRAVNELVNIDILIPRKMRYPAGCIIYDCPDILNVWEKIDLIIINKQNGFKKD